MVITDISNTIWTKGALNVLPSSFLHLSKKLHYIQKNIFVVAVVVIVLAAADVANATVLIVSVGLLRDWESYVVNMDKRSDTVHLY